MRSYNSEYEDYYKNLVRGKSYGYGKQEKSSNQSRIARRLIQDFAGTLALLFIIIVCKSVQTPQTQAFYNYSKQLVDKDFNYQEFYDNVKKTSYGNSITQKVEEILDVFNSNLLNIDTIKEKIDDGFTLPVDSESKFDEEKDYLIYRLDSIEPILSSSDGKVKKVMNTGVEGKTIVIDHGAGLETIYSNLNNVYVQEGEEIEAGYTIGDAGKPDEDTEVKFQILYMGQNRNLTSYLDR